MACAVPVSVMGSQLLAAVVTVITVTGCRTDHVKGRKKYSKRKAARCTPSSKAGPPPTYIMWHMSTNNVWHAGLQANQDSLSNGCLMRITPLAIWSSRQPADVIAANAAAETALTHPQQTAQVRRFLSILAQLLPGCFEEECIICTWQVMAYTAEQL